VVEDRQQQRLEQHPFGEGRLDHDDGGVGEVELALRVAPDVAGEAVRREPLQRRVVHHPGVREVAEGGVVEPELLDRVEDPADTGHHAVPTPLGEPTTEQLEHRTAVRGAAGQGGLQHRQLVVVSQEGGRLAGHVHGGHPSSVPGRGL
jgi:hypothetical protein